MRPLHLGLVGPVPPPSGGMAMQTQQLADLLRNEGLQVEIVATNARYRPAFVAKIKGLRALFRLLPYVAAVWKLAGRVDVVHLMSNSGWSWQLFSAPVVWLCWMRSTPVIVNYRGGEAKDYFSDSFRYVEPTLKRVFSVVVPSAYLEGVFRGFGVSTYVVPNIVDIELFRPAVRPKLNELFTLVVARNLESIYGIETAIAAMAIVSQSVPSLKLQIAGSGPQLKALEDLVLHYGLQSRVTFLGRLSRDEMAQVYQSADAMLNPTTVDNMPNSVIEALACGLPVISTNVGGVPFLVEHETTALLVPPGDPESMAQAIIRLVEDPALQERLRDNGLQQVVQYSWPQVKERWVGLYSRAAGQLA